MTDRELLELAAKAADLGEIKIDDRGWVYRCAYQGDPKEWEMWNPLTDDGDALRLAVKLGLAVIPYPFYARPKHSVVAKVYEHSLAVYRDVNHQLEQIEIYGDDPYAATRRAITRAAAEIGKTL